MLKIIENCKFCGSDTAVCAHCNLTGEYIRWKVSLAPNVFYSPIVLEAFDIAEFAALTNPKKAQVQLVLSCGFVDLNEGKAGRVHLWNLFGDESVTVTNLTILLGGGNTPP